jgi:predicted PurR-regulated permease PerM
MFLEINKKTLRNLFLVVAAGIVLYWLLHETERVKVVWGVIKGIFSPFVLGAGLAFIMNVPMRAFEKRLTKIKNDNLRRLIAVVLTLVAVCLVLALVFILLIPQLVSTVQSLVPSLIEFVGEVETYFYNFLNENPQLMEWVIVNTDFENIDWASLIQQAISVFGSSVSTLVVSAFSAIGSVFGAVVNFVIAIVFALYSLFQKEVLARQGRRLLYAFVPEKAADYVVRVLRLTNSTFSNFLSGQCVEVCILGSLFAITMAIFKMPYIPLISVLIAVTAFIPIVGAFVGCIVGAFLIFVNDPILAAGFVVMFLVLQQIENNLIYPRVVGNSIGLNGMWVLMAVAVGGELFGVAGMFLMIPIASVVYTLLREWTHKRLDANPVDPEKLKDQPPEMYSHFKEKRKENKAKFQKRRTERQAKRENKEE